MLYFQTRKIVRFGVMFLNINACTNSINIYRYVWQIVGARGHSSDPAGPDRLILGYEELRYVGFTSFLHLVDSTLTQVTLASGFSICLWIAPLFPGSSQSQEQTPGQAHTGGTEPLCVRSGALVSSVCRLRGGRRVNNQQQEGLPWRGHR